MIFPYRLYIQEILMLDMINILHISMKINSVTKHERKYRVGGCIQLSFTFCMCNLYKEMMKLNVRLFDPKSCCFT